MDDKLIVTVQFFNPLSEKMLPNEWIITFEKNDIKDIRYDNVFLIILTCDNKEIKLNLYDGKHAYAEIRRWMEK
ncbi:MAG: hypothetical protein QW134_05125 [Nitrososphaeria archaeon]